MSTPLHDALVEALRATQSACIECVAEVTAHARTDDSAVDAIAMQLLELLSTTARHHAIYAAAGTLHALLDDLIVTLEQQKKLLQLQ